MKLKKRTSQINTIFALLILLTLTFIWSRSFKSIPESRAESEAVLNFLRPLLEMVFGEGSITNHLIRKIAHFFEFFVLGIEISVLVWQNWGYSKKRMMGMVLLSGFLCGSIDETIQAFTGRGNQFSDVLLDFSGFTVGAVLIFVFALITNNKRSV